ncbi:TPA: UDP-glucose 4-epimerase GalE [Candidatus Acetothermia bacterium]|nr:UDP-glucose 4-epimerase GalE [Candidatus Acetothermia bacterium]HAZ30609.1 UDP-glucose 4-epimerase GalE [Candidatus Acetothermia bacterium]
MILVTGGAGYIGSHTIKELLRDGREVVALDNLSAGHRELVLCKEFVEGDLCDGALLKRTFRRYPIRAVVHFAAFTAVGESVHDPQKYYQNNVVYGLNLLAAMVETGVRTIVFSSSAAVYGDPVQVPILEDHPTIPKNPYGRTKLMFEGILADYGTAYGLRHVSLRYFNAAGSDPEGEIGECHDPETHLIPIVLEAAAGKRSHVEIFGTDYDTSDGTAVRDYIHVTDLARAHVLALKALESERAAPAYNLGIGRGYTVREVVEVCRKVSGREIRAVEAPRRAGDPAALVADPTRAKRDLGWKPKFTTLEPIVETAWRWMQCSREQ